MRTKLLLSSLTLLLFALLGAGSFSEKDISNFFTLIIAIVVIVVVIAIIAVIVENYNKNKRLRMIKEDEENSSDFDRSVYIGDDRCKIYFDSKKKQVMLMRVMTEGIKKDYVDDFDFPGKELAIYTSPVFSIYDPIKRRILSGIYNDYKINYQITSIEDKDNNKGVTINNTIPPQFKTLSTYHTMLNGSNVSYLYNILIDECHGLMVLCENGGVKEVFNYINAKSLPNKRGDKSTINTKSVGNYLFIMDDFFKVLVLFGPNTYEILKYADIIEVSYEENGDQLFTKSAARTVGGAIVGGVLMGGAGAVVGGLSGASKQNKEIKNMDIKILLRSTSRTSLVLQFKNYDRILKLKENSDRELYDVYLNNANQAKDIFSVIIDNAKQANTSTSQPETPIVSPSSPSIADELAKLAKLKADGILTEDEFQAQKAKLLGC